MTVPINRASIDVPTAKPKNTALTGTDQLGKQEFLQLLVAQLRNQDPMKPMEDREFIAQLAQFSSLETMQSIDQRLQALADAQTIGQAAGLLGKQIEAKLADGTTVTGTVDQVKVVNGTPRYLVGGKTVEPGQIVSIGSGSQR